MIDYLIKNGLVVDGGGGEPVETSIGIAGERIVYTGSGEIEARYVIDAKGLVVSPGFIDTHAHSEFTILSDGRAEGKLTQGVATEINGNCGLSAAPLYGESSEQREKALEELGVRERWSTFREYFRLLEKRGMGVNFVTLCGHGNIRASVMGYKGGTADEGDLSRMRQLLREALKDGARGLSTGLVYPPGVYSTTEELIGLSSVLASVSSDLVYTTHMRSEGDRLIEAIEEVGRIAKGAGVSVHISHVKTSGRRNWHKLERAVALMEELRSDGVGLTCDCYPYTAASTDLDVMLPSWVYEGGTREELRRLRDAATVKRIISEIEGKGGDYLEGVYISSVKKPWNKWMEGESLTEVSSRMGMKPVEALLKVIIEEEARAGAIFFSMDEDNLRRFLSLPYTMIGSDSPARCSTGPTHTGKPHPRGFGTFPRFIGRYVRDSGLMSLPEAIRRITSLPARTFGLQGRGLIKEGYYADIVLFDYGRVTDRATYKDPYKRSEGIVHLFVNGTLALREGEPTGALSGRILK